MAVGLARRLSKLGICSRSEATRRISEGRVFADRKLVTDPEFPTQDHTEILMDGVVVTRADSLYLMLNKPRGLITTASDEHARGTVYDCLRDLNLPWVAPVGRLDKASEGLLLLSNDPQWAARITDPVHAILKRYHVQIDQLASEALIERLCIGAQGDGEDLRARGASIVRSGQRNTWLEIELDEGRNRHIRRLLEHFGIGVLRLIRISIGSLELGDLAKGETRHLSASESAQF